MLIAIARFVINVVPEAMADSITRSLAAMTQRPRGFGAMDRWSSLCMDGAAVLRKWLR